MDSDSSTAWWRDSSAEFGPRILDSTLRGENDWDKVLENGRKELERVMQKTGMRTGKDLSLLEIGCGMGRMSFALADRYGYVLGLDISPALLDEARRHNDRPNVKFELADGERIRPQEAREWDVVFSFGVFYYLGRDTVGAYARDIYPLLRPGGQFLFDTNCVPIRFRTRMSWFFRRCLYAFGVKDWRGWPTAPGHRRKYHSVRFLRALLESIGFQLERVTDETPNDTWFVAVKPALPT
jgi:SAM-dependent methyltransferase